MSHETAVRPLADNMERKLSGIQWLRQLKGSRTAGAEEMIVRWDELDARKRRPVWWIALFAALAIL